MPDTSAAMYVSAVYFFEASSSGRTAGFDPAYRGSNPCTSAKFGDRIGHPDSVRVCPYG